jgi:RNA polymerase sigma-70 factor (ECF subfamily)
MPRTHRSIPLHLVSDKACAEADDATLARALMAGNSWAHTMAWNRFASTVFNMASHTLGNEDEAKDVTQEVFYRLFARAKTLRKPESLRSFVVSFAIRILKWHLRRRRANAWLSLYPPKDLPEAPFGGSDPEARDALRRFYGLLDRLATRERLIFSLRHLESMEMQEIAAATDLSLSTVRRTHERAALKMSRWIESDEAMAGFLEKGRTHHGV